MGVGEQVLIIDKDGRSRERLYRICHHIGIEALKVATWAEAQARLKKRNYNIVILGLDLPRAQAVEAIRTIRRLGLDSCILIVAKPANAPRIVIALKEGAYDTILKPINTDWAQITITRAIERRSYYDDAQKKDHYWKLSIFDELTRIHNHRYFHYTLTKAINSAQRYRYPLSLLMMDIDNCKAYNDNYGHLAGDEVLRVLGSFFTRSIRAGDMVARYGGEEFAVILPHTNKHGARAMAELLRKEVEHMEFTPPGVVPPARLTISIGVASAPSDTRTKDKLIRIADMALYRAKRKNKNRVCCG